MVGIQQLTRLVIAHFIFSCCCAPASAQSAIDFMDKLFGQAIRHQKEAGDTQRYLSQLGYYNGAIDGVLGRATEQAIRNFQRDHGFQETGRLRKHERTLLRKLARSDFDGPEPVAVAPQNAQSAELRCKELQERELKETELQMERFRSRNLPAHLQNQLSFKTASHSVDGIDCIVRTIDPASIALAEGYLNRQAISSSDTPAPAAAEAMEVNKAREEAARKGPDYAEASGTKWSVHRKTDEMTDSISMTAVSTQRAANGALSALLTVSCEHAGLLAIHTLLTDHEGNPSLTFPDFSEQLFATKVRMRVNALDPFVAFIRNIQFSNQFLLTKMRFTQSNTETPPQVNAHNYFSAANRLQETFVALQLGGKMMVDELPGPQLWRLLVEFETSVGTALIRVPVFDPAIQAVIKACNGHAETTESEPKPSPPPAADITSENIHSFVEAHPDPIILFSEPKYAGKSFDLSLDGSTDPIGEVTFLTHGLKKPALGKVNRVLITCVSVNRAPFAASANLHVKGDDFMLKGFSPDGHEFRIASEACELYAR